MFLDKMWKAIYIESRSKVLEQELEKLGIKNRLDSLNEYESRPIIYVGRDVNDDLYFARLYEKHILERCILDDELNMEIESEEEFLKKIKAECKEWNSRKNKKEY